MRKRYKLVVCSFKLSITEVANLVRITQSRAHHTDTVVKNLIEQVNQDNPFHNDEEAWKWLQDQGCDLKADLR